MLAVMLGCEAGKTEKKAAAARHEIRRRSSARRAGQTGGEGRAE